MRANSIAAAAARAVAVMACFTACALGSAQPPADVALTGGKIVTVDAGFTIAEAIAIDDGRIVAVGTNDAIRRYVGAATQVIDVGGATVIPGLIDNHFHFARAVQRWHLQARLDGVDSRREALRILADKAAASPEGQWVMVQGGWSPQQFADAPGGFTLAELDARRAAQSAVRAAGLQHRLRELARAARGRSRSQGRRAAQCRGPRDVPAAVRRLHRAHSADDARAVRAQPHGLHAHAERRRAHGRVQLGPRPRGRVGAHRGACAERGLAAAHLGDADVRSDRPRGGRCGRRADRAQPAEHVPRRLRLVRARRARLSAVLRPAESERVRGRSPSSTST